MEGIRHLEFVTIYTRNLGAARDFYVSLLGFKVLREKPRDFLQVDMAGVPICIDLVDEKRPTTPNNIGIAVDDLDQTIKALKAKALVVELGSNPASKERWAAVKDPDGNELIFLVHE